MVTNRSSGTTSGSNAVVLTSDLRTTLVSVLQSDTSEAFTIQGNYNCQYCRNLN